MDSRSWADIGIVLSRSVEEDGIYLECETQPLGERVSARVAVEAGGPGWAVYRPIPVGAQVLIAYPGGDMRDAVVYGVLPNEEDTLPDQIREEPDTLWLIAAPGAHVRVRASGSGSVTVIAGSGGVSVETSGSATLKASAVYVDSGSVNLGSGSSLGPLAGVVVGQGVDPFTGWTYAMLGSASSVVKAKK